MPKLFKLFAVLFSLFWCVTLVAQQKIVNPDIDASPTHKSIGHGDEAIWDLLFSYDVTAASGDAGNAGAEFDGTNFYTTRWASNLIHEYDINGNLLREFSVPGVTGLRDLAYDGTYFYGGASGSVIYQMDFGATPTLVSTISVTGVTVRNIAYDEANDGFWVGNWADPPTLFDRSGNQLAQIVTGFAGQYGSAYDNVSPGGPYLWVFDQGAGAGTPQLIHQFDIATGTATGVTFDVSSVATDPAGIAGGLWTSTDYATGFMVIGALIQGAPDEMLVFELASAGPPCPIDQATNPDPVNGATDVDINLASINWTNGAGANNVEVWFDGTMVYDGTAITTWAISGPLDYSTTYSWKIVGKNDTCSVPGPLWSFTTTNDPNIVQVFMDDFEGTLDNWTITNDGGDCVWMQFFEPWPNAYTLPPPGGGGVLSADSDECGSGTTLLSTATMSAGVDATQGPGFNTMFIEFDHDFRTIQASDESYVEVSLDGGATWTEVVSWLGVDAREEHYISTGMATNLSTDIRFRLRSIQPGWDWWWAVDNFAIYFTDPVPVELTSFVASVNKSDVILNWTTATELNNMGFEVQRSNGDEFTIVGFVEGNGTVTNAREYTYTDKNLDVGSYTYRLRQVDFDGTSEFSEVVEVEVLAPDVYGLEQNYPNPFNPSTQIRFSLAADSKVTLKVFDILGQEVANLISSNLAAGSHEFNFDASNLNSGVYFYRIDATGVDGTNFTSVKKMILTK